MKKLLVIVLVFIFSCVSSFAIATIADVNIIAEEVSPEPVEPGHDITVKISIHNGGGETAKNVNVKLDAKYPFYLKGESQGFKEFEDLPVGFSKDNTYYLVVDPRAVSGIYTIKFTATIDERIKVEKEISIRVIGVPDIIFESQDGGIIKPGDVFLANITLFNIGSGKARNIKLIPQSTKFISLGSGLKIVEELKPDESANILLEFNVGEEVSPDSYNIPIQVAFLDETGAAYEFTENLGVRLANYGEVYLQNWKIIPSNADVGEEFTLQIRLENVGSGDAKNVKAVLQNTMGGNKEIFIGRLEKDEDVPGIFTLAPRLPGRTLNKLTITHTDDFGEHVISEEFSINVGIASKPVGLIVALIMVGALIGLYLLFFRNKYYLVLRKKKEK